ncbi:hypothetical protein [Scytonema sp. NUACC26]|uniref:hypothetical protein n=1 Tax=Scytonema sp. NUACC26 TaxID=3140176 RepID=UPI0034DBB10A
MKLQIGNLWDAKADVYLATTNAVLNNREELVMGAGSALEMKQRYPDAPQLFGQVIRGLKVPYGVIILEQLGIGAFQTKDHYKHGSDLTIIERSTEYLANWCVVNPNKFVALPAPGIGYGGLTYKQIRPIIKYLPDTVTVFVFSNSQLEENVA